MMRGQGLLAVIVVALPALACRPAAALDPSEAVEAVEPRGPVVGNMRLEDLSETRGRPLFSPSRRPPPAPVVAVAIEAPPEVVAEAPPPPPSPPDLALVGIVGVGERMTAVFKDPASTRLKRLRSSDVVLGWTLRVTSPKSVVFEREDERVVHTLFKP